MHSITSRAKEPASFEKKAAKPSPRNPSEPKYTNPLEDITDKAGVRVISYFLSTVEAFDQIINDQLIVSEKINKSGEDPDRFGYQSVHYLVRLRPERTAWPEYRRFADLIAEIQVRTILQHAWAEIEHDMQYKAVAALPTKVQRRFAALAGLIEIADREFQAIEAEGQELRAEARKNVDLGKLEEVEVTDDSIRAYLDRKYGPDGRMKSWAYSFLAKMLRNFGFATLAEVDACVTGYDDSAVSRAIYGGRQGQITRFEDVLLAAMGARFVFAHPYYRTDNQWFVRNSAWKVEKLVRASIPIGDFKPSEYPENLVGAEERNLLESARKGEQAKFARHEEELARLDRQTDTSVEAGTDVED